jgi:hypothetical protein
VDIIRIVSKIRFTSEPRPIRDPEIVARAASAISVAEAMGLVDVADRAAPLTYDAIRAAADRVAAAGIGRQVAATLRAAEAAPAKVATLLERLEGAMRESPSPATEWPRLESILGADLLGRLVGVSPASVRRYREGERATPDDVAARLHFLALVVADLLGTYNEIGVRRWFDRRRERLGGRAPSAILHRAWAPEDPGARDVRDLARALVTFSAT